MKRIVKKFFMYIQLFFSSEYEKANVYSRYLGVKFGKSVRMVSYPRFGSEPYLISIGDNVSIARGVCFVNHDGGASMFRQERPGINVFGRIKVGNNVVIGINSIILPGVTIGDNVMIGAGSIISKDVPSNVVVAGVPAKVIATIDAYKASVFSKGVSILEKDPELRKRKIIEFLDKSNSVNDVV